MKRLLTLTLIILFSIEAFAQTVAVKDFKPACDSLTKWMTEKTTVKCWLKIKSIKVNEGKLDFYFDESLSDFPLRRGDAEWFHKQLSNLIPKKYKQYKVGEIYTTKNNVNIKRLEVASLSNTGSSYKSHNRAVQPTNRQTIVKEVGAPIYATGLSGRNIALWHSHGYYFDNGSQRWTWQRPCIFQTVEDLYTQGYVLTFLIPMLENAGAYILTPRERDTQKNEVIADNDLSCGSRGTSEYIETGKWKSIEGGFADSKDIYTGIESPFGMGTARKAPCSIEEPKAKHADVVWRPNIPEKGEYAVYISYKSLPESTTSAHYTVHHKKGKTDFIVNQKLGGDMWIYLGTFEFDKGTEGYVSLTSIVPEGYTYAKRSVITADAVRFGGGIGNIARANSNPEIEPETSGMPRYMEGARYWMQWSGADTTLFNASSAESDYKDDYMCRGDWVAWISGGSCTNPGKPGKGIPVDLTLGFHTDAGVTKDDAIIGTLAIYTGESDGRLDLPSGESRITSREFADIVQSQIVNDIRSEFNPEWRRRQLWNRGYRESRTPTSPSMLLELLSHQNFADMKYGLDPAFRFFVSRSVYKGMLKYLSNRYGIPYTVQPLPVSNMSSEFLGTSRVLLKWTDTKDKLEPTADPTGYILYTRVDDGSYDIGQIIVPTTEEGTHSFKVDIEPGHIYSFKIEAFNDGGKSFPSETICVGVPANRGNSDKQVLVVNNFDRVSGPVFFDTPEYAGFNNSLDSGIPYMRDISFIGEMYQHYRDTEYSTNVNAGFGSSHQNYIGKTVAGNTFDYAYIHGKAIMNAGYPFSSCSNEAFCGKDSLWTNAWCVDMICGKQVTTVIGNANNKTRYTVFEPQMQQAITDYTNAGGNILVSGAYIATDIWSSIYKYAKDAEATKTAIKFAEDVLGYRWASSHASWTGEMYFTNCKQMSTEKGGSVTFYNSVNEDFYSVESPDGLAPRGNSKVFIRYSDSDIPAGICKEGEGYKTVCIGFPIEAVKNHEDIENIISLTLEYFSR